MGHKSSAVGGFWWATRVVQLEVSGGPQERCSWRFLVGHKSNAVGGFWWVTRVVQLEVFGGPQE